MFLSVADPFQDRGTEAGILHVLEFLDNGLARIVALAPPGRLCQGMEARFDLLRESDRHRALQDDPTPNPRSSRPVVVKQRTFRGQRGGAEDLITGAGRRSAAGRESDGAAIWAETSNRTKPDRPRPGARRAEHAGSVYAH